jgi:hypothetical protein
MNRSVLRAAIVILGLATALIHLYLNIFYGEFSVLFTLNGLGYLALLAALFLNVRFVANRRKLVHYLFIGYTVVTIVAWIAIGSRDMVAYADKVIEVLLVIALALSLVREG